jgi:hypothetical protein
MKEMITDIINRWDPVDLFPFAPCDEYKREIESIVALIGDTSTIEDIAIIVFNVFNKSCGNDVFKKSLSDCKVIYCQQSH